MCYFTNWSQYRVSSGKFLPANIEANLCTHLIYAFSGINDANELVTIEWNDEELYKSLNGLKQRCAINSTQLEPSDHRNGTEYSLFTSLQKSQPKNTAGSRRMDIWNSQVRHFSTRSPLCAHEHLFKNLSSPAFQIHNHGVNTNQQK